MKKMKVAGSAILGLALILQISTSAYAEETLPGATSSSATVTTTGTAISEMEQSQQEEQEQKKQLDITPKFEITTIHAVTGDSGVIKVLPVNGVEVTGGTFLYHSMEALSPIVTLHQDGKWDAIALGSGRTSVFYDYSQETLNRISEAYPEYELVRRLEGISVTFNVSPPPPAGDYLDITPHYSVDAIHGNIGDKGRIEVMPLYGVEVTGGKFTFPNAESVKSIISLHEDGSWEIVGSGSCDISIRYEYSQETLRKLVEKYPNRELLVDTAEHLIPVNNRSLPPTGTVSVELSSDIHLQGRGWMPGGGFGDVLGTQGEARRLEAYSIKLSQFVSMGQDGAATAPWKGDIEYRSHVQSTGWETQWCKNGQISGSYGDGKRIEAVQIRLTGELAEVYDIQYRVHVQGYGWTHLVKNGETAGTEGQGRRVEAIQIYLIPKG